MKSDSEFVNVLSENIRRRGAMDKLVSDSARVEISKHVLNILRALFIENWQSEPYFQHQNFAERRWRDVKRYTNWVMDVTGAPEDAWLLCLEYVADVMNLTYNQSIDGIPLQKLTGQTQDSSILMLFKFWQPVYVSKHNESFPEAPEVKGRFVGFAKHVGHAFTYKVLTDDTCKIMHRSCIRPVPTEPVVIESTPDDPNIKQYIHSKQDKSGNISVDDLIPCRLSQKSTPKIASEELS